MHPARCPGCCFPKRKKKLVGNGSKKWVVVREETYLRRGKDCPQDTYTFNANHTATIERCFKGTLEKARVPWSMSDIDKMDRELKIEYEAYLMRFLDKPGEEWLRLRIRPRRSGSWTYEKILRHTSGQ